MKNKLLGILLLIGLALIMLPLFFAFKHERCEKKTIAGVMEIGELCS